MKEVKSCIVEGQKVVWLIDVKERFSFAFTQIEQSLKQLQIGYEKVLLGRFIIVHLNISRHIIKAGDTLFDIHRSNLIKLRFQYCLSSDSITWMMIKHAL